jgi:hypothetical protein
MSADLRDALKPLFHLRLIAFDAHVSDNLEIDYSEIYKRGVYSIRHSSKIIRDIKMKFTAI